MNSLTKLFARQKAAHAEVHGTLDETRQRITVLKDERARIEQLPIPPGEAEEAVDGWLDDIFVRGALSVSGFTTGQWSNTPTINDRNAVAIIPALLIGSCRAAVREHLVAQLRDWYEGREFADAAEKAERLRSIDADLDQLQRVEERLIRQAEQAGIPVLRREDADPEIAILRDDQL